MTFCLLLQPTHVLNKKRVKNNKQTSCKSLRTTSKLLCQTLIGAAVLKTEKISQEQFVTSLEFKSHYLRKIKLI